MAIMPPYILPGIAIAVLLIGALALAWSIRRDHQRSAEASRTSAPGRDERGRGAERHREP